MEKNKIKNGNFVSTVPIIYFLNVISDKKCNESVFKHTHTAFSSTCKTFMS